MTKKNNEQPENQKKPQQEEHNLVDQETPSNKKDVDVSVSAKKDTHQSETSTDNDKIRTTSAATSKKEKEKEKEKEKKPSNKLAIIAILIALGIGAAGFYKLQEQNRIYQAEIAALKTQFELTQSQLTSSLESTQSATIEKATELTHQAEVAIEQQQNSIESLQLAIADVQGRRPNDWLLAEADHLIKLAGRKLFLEKDAVTATHLIEAADQRIATLNDPSLVPLRQQIAKDITTLKGIPLIDREGLILRLTALQQQVSHLPLANAILPEEQEAEEIVVSSDINDWQDNLKNSLKSFGENFITFRSRDGNVIPLVSPQQHFYLSENIKGKLETSIKAVYLEQGKIYQTALINTLEWSEMFFDQSNHQVQQFNAAIKELQEQDINVTYPQKLVSQQPLEDVINDRLRRSVTSITEEKE